MGAQSAIRGRQERYARESGYDPSLYTPEQLRQLNRLASNRGKLSTSDTAHLDQSQKEMVGNQISNDEEKIINNPAGQPSPTLNQIVNDSMTGVNFGGQELPIVLGSDGTPKVMEGYKPQDYAGGFEGGAINQSEYRFDGTPSYTAHQDDPSKALNDPMLKGLTLPSGDVLPFNVSQGGVFESPLLNPQDAQVFANRYKNQMLPDGKTPKYNVDIVNSSRGSTLSVSPNYLQAEKPEEKTLEQNRVDYVMENWKKIPSSIPNPNFVEKAINQRGQDSRTPEQKQGKLFYTDDERMQIAGNQFDSQEAFKKNSMPPINEYTGEPRQSVMTSPVQNLSSPALPQQTSQPINLKEYVQQTSPEPTLARKGQSVLNQSQTMPESSIAESQPINLKEYIQQETPTPASQQTSTQKAPQFRKVESKVLFNNIDRGKQSVEKLSNEELMMLSNELEIYRDN